MKLLVIICFVFAVVYGENLKFEANNKNEKENWALLVAGSNEYDNYRHQADVCHAYQVLISKGVAPDHIIVMMYDDVANNSMNPHKGKLFNHPHGPDVYQSISIDYRTTDVTPKNFLAVLQGDEEKMKGVGSGRVIKSTSSDHIFLNMVDHGAPGLFCFPEEMLYAKDLLAAIEDMHQKQKYNKMVIYMESCESGSMFNGLLPTDINVYVTTAANPGESSFACYWDDAIGAYLGDVYSVVWMADSEKEDSTLETLHKQFLVVRKDTNTSHVTLYGDEKLGRETVEDYQGSSQKTSLRKSPPPSLTFAPWEAVASEDVPLATLYRRLDLVDANSEQAQQLKHAIKNAIRERDDVEELMNTIVKRAASMAKISHSQLTSKPSPPSNHLCYQQLTQAFHKACFSITKNGYARKKLNVLWNMCEAGREDGMALQLLLRTCASFRLDRWR